MDTSEIYIKMCDCSEIQEQSPPFELWVEGQLVTGDKIYNSESKHIWLPRQDQLQEMMGGFQDTMFILADGIVEQDLKDFEEDGTPKHDNSKSLHQFFDSWEQLWLAFVMKEKFGKVWSKKGWTDA